MSPLSPQSFCPSITATPPVNAHATRLPPIQASQTLLHNDVMLVLWRRQARTLGCEEGTHLFGTAGGAAKAKASPLHNTKSEINLDPSGRNLNAFPLPHRDAQGLKGGQTQGIVLKEYMCLVMRALLVLPSVFPSAFGLPQLDPYYCCPASTAANWPTQRRSRSSQGGQAVSNSMQTAVVSWGQFSTRSFHSYHRRVWTSDWMAVRRCWQHFW